MSIHEFKPAAAAHRIGLYWRLARAAYRYVNTATHHVFGAVVKLVILAYFIFAVLFLSLRYVVLPNIDRYKSDVEQIASRSIGRPVTISTIYASWKGLRPYLFLGGVAIHDRNGREALALPGVAATFSWWSVVYADVRLYTLEVSRPDLNIERDTDGKLFVGGIFIDPAKPGDGKGVDWVLAQREIIIRDGRLSWNDHKRGAPELALDQITFLLRNDWRHHALALKARPPESFAAPLDVRAAFDHPHFARRVSDFTQWKGELYADLRDTDLAVWKTYADYPVDVQKGRGAVRAWLNFDRAKVADFTADLMLEDVSARLRMDLQPLNLVRVGGRISMREAFGEHTADGKPSFGAQGHAVALKDFSLQTDDGLVLPATTVSETYSPQGKGHPERTEVSIESLDLGTLAQFIERLPVPDAQRKMLADFAPGGRLKNFSARWQGSYPDIVSYRVKGDFAGLSMKAQAARPAKPKTAAAPAQAAVPAIPGFNNLTGSLDASDKGGSFSLASSALAFDLPGYFDQPVMPFAQLNMQANWKFQADDQLQLDIRKMNFVQEGASGSLHGTHVMPLTARQDQPLGTIDMVAHLDRLELNRVGDYLPSQTPQSLRHWLTGGLAGGTAQDVDMTLRGDLSQFPFHQNTPPNRQSANAEFSVAGKIRDGKLNYTPGHFAADGKKPFWPLLDAIEGTIRFDRTRMEINATSARTHNVTLSDVKAVIPDLLAQDLLLAIDGNAAGPLQEFVGYTNDSPVAEWIAHFTERTTANGQARLGLKLALPLNRLAESKVQGTLQFAGNDVVLLDAMPPLQATNGKLDFNEKGVTLGGIRTNFLGGPVTVSGGTQSDGNIVIKADGSISSAGLRKTFATPATQKLTERISGASRYVATISVKNKRPEVLVESNLQGMAFDFPAPLRKAANETMPLRFDLVSLATEEAASARDELKLSLGTTIAARYLRTKNSDRNASWQVVRGGIGVNVPAPQPDSGVIANVNLRALNIDAWSRVVSSIVSNDRQKAAGATADALNLAQYIEPEVLAARATELVVAGKKLDNVVVGASHQKGIWQANIDSEQVSGYVTWNEGGPGQAMGKATARLASLVIPKSAASEVGDLLEGKNTTTQIPALDITADHFELFGKKLGRLELVADNAADGAAREWRIGKLTIVNPDGELTASGKWSSRDGESRTNLNYVLDVANAGKLLDRLGFNNVLRGGKGRLDGDLNWKGLPFAFDVPSLSGQLKLELAAGQFLKVDPGAAKLLGVLSLQSLPRRLALDFRDVFSEGFAFDGIAGTANIQSGVLKTDNLKMRSINATVLMDGNADIARESQNLHVVVIPEINAGTASVVYALAVNPVIGVGTFLAQLFLREPLTRAFTFQYSVTGPWKDPVVTKLERRDDGTSRRSAPDMERAG
jgi:uncharacterized protein (TIGR02099 family)